MLGVPIKLSKTPVKPRQPGPLLGQHTKEILLQLGYTPEAVAEPQAEGVIGQPDLERACGSCAISLDTRGGSS